MGERAADEAYRALIHWLRANGLSWVAVQVEDEVTLGKVRAERISVSTDIREFNPSGSAKTVRRTSAEFVGRADYTAEEKFEMVSGAVRAVVVGGAKIQDVLAKTLGAADHTSEIRFEPGETGDVSHSFRPTEVVSRRAHVDEIERLFDELIEDVKRAD